MDAVRWARLQSLFHAAADVEIGQRRSFLIGQCADDPSLVDDANALLDEDERGGSILDRDVAGVARDLFQQASKGMLPAEKFGPYRAIRLLGEGGMGVVFLAERDDLGTQAAVKILRDAWLSPARQQRFASEQRTLAQLNHPLIARLFDADVLADGTPWFAMEYVDGLTLTEYCSANNLSVDERLRLFRRVCEAVQFAHQHLIIHRDLKPSNILVTPSGGVKLLDFGIAKQLDIADDRSDRTRTSARLMTPAYAAPEQQAGSVGIYTDVYALGVILYELLTGTRPCFSDDGARGDDGTAFGRDPRAPSALAGDRSLSRSEWADLDVLALTAMRFEPQRRYATVDAMIRDVDHYLNAEPLEARPERVAYRTRKFLRRNRSAVTAGAIAVTVVIGIIAFYTVRVTRARNDALQQAARAQRIQAFTLNLFQGGDKVAGPADSLRVITLVNRGVNDARSLDADPTTQAEVFLTLGTIYQQLGQLDRADSLMGLAVDRRTRINHGPNRELASTLIALGLLRVDQAKFGDAERLVREGLAMATRTMPRTDPEFAKATAALGRVLQERGAYDRAIPVLQEAVRLDEASAVSTQDVAGRLSALADANYYAGHLDVADSINRRVLAMYRQSLGERHPVVADVLLNLGATQFDRGNYAVAERLDRQSLEITRAFYGDNHYKTAAGLTVLGRALVFQNRFDEATTILEHALSIREGVYGPVHPAVASTINELGNIAMQRDQYDAAAKHFGRMLSIYRTIYGDDHYLIGIATSNLAGVEMGRKNYPRAEALYRTAVKTFTAAQGPEHLNTGISRIKLGRALLRQQRFAEAAIESRAGYDVLAAQANPAVSFLHNARKDLVASFDSLHQPALSARFRAELAAEPVPNPSK